MPCFSSGIPVWGPLVQNRALWETLGCGNQGGTGFILQIRAVCRAGKANPPTRQGLACEKTCNAIVLVIVIVIVLVKVILIVNNCNVNVM